MSTSQNNQDRQINSFERNLREDNTDCYSFRNAKLWCHNCRKEFKKLIQQSRQEILCSDCNFALEIVENEQDHPSNYNIFGNNQNQGGEQQNQQQPQFQQQQQQQQNRQRQQRQNPFIIFQHLVNPEEGGFFGIINNSEPNGQNQMNFLDDFLFGLLGAFQNQTTRQVPATEEKIENLQQIIAKTDDKDSQCPICYENYKKGEIINELPCTHQFHKSCVKQWLGQQNSCPMCREEI